MTERPPEPSESPEPSEPSADEALAAYGRELADAVDAALAGWVDRSVRRVAAGQGLSLDAEAEARLAAAAGAARAEGGERVRALLATDVDEQVGNPLAVLRSLVRYPTEVLPSIGA